MPQKCDCPKLDVRVWVNGDNPPVSCCLNIQALTQRTKTPSLYESQVANQGVSLIFAKAEPLKNCGECRDIFSQTFGIPDMWWEKYFRRSNGYFGVEHILDQQGHDDGLASWSRFIMKRVQDIKQSIPVGKDLKYSWPKVNSFSRWYPTAKHTTVILFEASEELKTSLACRLFTKLQVAELSDPFWIYPRLIGDILALQDQHVWNLRDHVRSTEVSRLPLPEPQSDYRRMHEIARHAIHISETLIVSIGTIESIQNNHEMFLHHLQHGSRKEIAASRQITYNLSNQRQHLVGFHARSESNKARLANEISLGFNLASQSDSRIAVNIAHDTKADSSSMRTIAFVTSLFFPATFVSAIFSTSFFNYNPETGIWSVSDRFWIYWVVAAPLTMVSVLIWFLWRFLSNRARVDYHLTSRQNSFEEGIELQDLKASC